MNKIIDLNCRREFGDCFYLEIPLDASLDEIKQRIHQATSIEGIVKRMLDAEIDIEEMVEEIEPIIKNLDIKMDDYLEVAEDNMNNSLLYLQPSKY